MPAPAPTIHFDIAHKAEVAADLQFEAGPDKGDFRMFASALAGWSWVQGCAVTPQSTPDLTVAVAAGYIMFGDTPIATPAATVSFAAAPNAPDSTNPRIGLVGIDQLPISTHSRTTNVATLVLAFDPVAQGWQVGDRIKVDSSTDNTFDVASGVLTGVSANTITYASTGSNTGGAKADSGVVIHVGAWTGAATALPDKAPFPTLPPIAPVYLAAVFMRAAEPNIDATNLRDKRLFSSGIPENEVRAADFGMGGVPAILGPYAGTTTGDGLALQAAYTQAITKAQWGGNIGCVLRLPPGRHLLTDGFNGTGNVVPLVLRGPTGAGGRLRIVGAGGDVTELSCPDRGSGTGCLGHTWTPTGIVRGGTGGGPADLNGSGFDDNTFTVTGASAHNGVLGQIIEMKSLSRGRPVDTHYTIQTRWGPGTHHTTVNGAQNLATVGSLLVASTTGYGASGQVSVLSDVGLQLCTYTSKDATHFIGLTGGVGTAANNADVYNPDFNSFQFQAGDHSTFKLNSVDDGSHHGTSGTPDPSRTVNGGYLDTLIPPLTYIDWDSDPVNPPAAVSNVFYFTEYLLEFLDYKSPHALHLEHFSVRGGSSTDTPLDGLGMRHCMKNHVNDSVVVGGWWIGAVISDNQHNSPPTSKGAATGQNSDHSWYHGVLEGNYFNLGFIDNSQVGYGSQGGGRDYHFDNSIFNRCGHSHIVVNDAGSMQTFDFDGANMAGGRHLIYLEGVDGVDPVENRGIDCILGWFKTEAQGTWAFAYDESGRRTFWKAMKFYHRCESSLTPNGAGGTPGGSGETAIGSFRDDTWKPWPALNLSFRNDTGVGTMPTIKADVPWQMFGVDGGIEIGTHVCFGWQKRLGTDGHTSGSKTFQSAAANFTLDDAPSSTAAGAPGATIVLDPTSPAVFTDDDGNPTRTDVVASVTNGGAVVMAHTIVAHATADLKWTIVDTVGQANASGLSVMSSIAMVKTISAPFSSGGGLYATITCERPDVDTTLFGTGAPTGYGAGLGTATSSPYSALIGVVGYMRVFMLDAWNAQVLHDTVAADKLCLGQQFYDLHSLRPGYIDLVTDDGPTTSKVLPHFRVWDGIMRSGADGTATSGNAYFTATSSRAAGLDVGKTVTLGAQSGTITYVNRTTSTDQTTARIGVSFTCSTTSSALAWTIGGVKNVDSPRFEVRRGQQRFEVMWHDGADTNPIPAGGCVEYVTSGSGNLRVRASRGDPTQCFAGISSPSATGGSAVTTNGATFPTTPGIGAPEVWMAGPTVLVAMPGTELTLGDDPWSFQPFSGFGHAVGDGKPLVDDGLTHPGYVKTLAGSPPTAAQRIVGHAVRGSTNTPYIAARVLPERWTY